MLPAHINIGSSVIARCTIHGMACSMYELARYTDANIFSSRLTAGFPNRMLISPKVPRGSSVPDQHARQYRARGGASPASACPPSVKAQRRRRCAGGMKAPGEWLFMRCAASGIQLPSGALCSRGHFGRKRAACATDGMMRASAVTLQYHWNPPSKIAPWRHSSNTQQQQGY